MVLKSQFYHLLAQTSALAPPFSANTHSGFLNHMHYLITLLLFVLGGLLVRLVVRFLIHRTAQRTRWNDADVVASAFGKGVLWTSFFVGIDFCIPMSFYPEWMQSYIHPSLVSLIILVFAILLPRSISALFLRHAERSGKHRTASTLLQKGLQFSIYLLALTLILDAYGVKITTMIATLGIGGLALALALQETLSNLFAGMYISLANQIRVGDVVLFEGNEGTVKDIGWRNTVIRKVDESLLITPNSKLSQSIVSAYPADAPFFRARLVLQLSLDEQLLKAESIVKSHIQGMCSSPDTLPESFLCDPAPLIRCSEAKDGIVELSLLFCVDSYARMPELRSVLFHQIQQLLLDQGIRLHNPHRKSA